MDKLKYIIQGWKNYVFEDEEVEVLAKKKASICSACEHAVSSTWDDILPDATLVEVQGMVCNLCSCPLSTLLRSSKACKDGRF